MLVNPTGKPLALGGSPGREAATGRGVSIIAAEAAKDGCPISGALKGNVELSVEATLAS